MTVIIGIVGGVASGKSLVSSQLEQLGAVVLNADRIGHEVLREPEVTQTLCARWGDQVLDNEGNIDRPAVARIVFAPTPEARQELAFLEQVTHPKIEQSLRERTAELVARAEVKAVVLDAALLLEAGWDAICEKIVFVEVPVELRQQRALLRGMSAEDFTAREAAQQSVENKRKKSGFLVDNSGSQEQTFSQVQAFWDSLE